RGVQMIRCASIFSTQPHGIPDQPWFLNTVLEAITVLDPDQLLRACLETEKENHRIRNVNKGPRTLDIDIIFYGNKIIRKPGLAIPHPSFSARKFVLAPLSEIAADFVDPLSGKTILQLLEACADQTSVLKANIPGLL